MFTGKKKAACAAMLSMAMVAPLAAFAENETRVITCGTLNLRAEESASSENSGQIRLGLRGCSSRASTATGRAWMSAARAATCTPSIWGSEGTTQLHRVCQDEQPRPEPARRAERQHPRLLSARHEGDRARHHRRMEQGQRGRQDRLYAEPLALRQEPSAAAPPPSLRLSARPWSTTRATRRCSSCAARPT